MREDAPDEHRDRQEPEERGEVPTEADAPPQAPTKQVAHAGLAFRRRRHEEGGVRDAEDRGQRGDRVEGDSFCEVDRQRQQPSRLEDDGQEDAPRDGVEHEQEGRHRVAGYQTPE